MFRQGIDASAAPVREGTEEKMSRIIAGAAGGLRLASVPGDTTRPTTDRVKESLFSKLESYGVLEGARVLDVYGGSGALGCEAASRGAASVEIVDKYPKAVRTIQRNVDAVVRACSVSGLNPQVKVRHSSARTYLSGALDVWDIVFVDPPYALPNEQVVEDLQQIAPHLAEGAIVVVERSARDSEPVWPKSVRRFAAKNHGETAVYYLEPDAAELSAEPVLGIAEKEN